jgi:hypothetical protein
MFIFTAGITKVRSMITPIPKEPKKPSIKFEEIVTLHSEITSYLSLLPRDVMNLTGNLYTRQKEIELKNDTIKSAELLIKIIQRSSLFGKR